MKQPRILVVDDDREIVGAIKKRLELEGYEVVPAYNGLEALDVLMEQEIHLLIIDIMMPGYGRTFSYHEDQGEQKHPDHHFIR